MALTRRLIFKAYITSIIAKVLILNHDITVISKTS